MAVVLISHSRYCFQGFVWKISIWIKKRINCQECSRGYQPTCCEKLQISKQYILLVVSRICQIDWDPQNLLFLHWFHHCRIKLLRFRGLSFKKRSLRMTVLTEIEKLVKENVLKFQIISLIVSQTCRIKLLRFRGLPFNNLFIYFYLFADDSTDRNERNQSRHISCRPESVLKRKCHLQTCVHKRTHRDYCKWSTLHFTQASSLR